VRAREGAGVGEPATDRSVGSSTMPQKRNPMMCEYVIAAARLLRGPLAVLESTAAHASERDMGAWAAEWLALPDAVILTAGLVAKLAHVLEGLEVDADRMEQNLGATGGAIMAGGGVRGLGPTSGHEPAHAAPPAPTRRGP